MLSPIFYIDMEYQEKSLATGECTFVIKILDTMLKYYVTHNMSIKYHPKQMVKLKFSIERPRAFWKKLLGWAENIGALG